MLLAPVFSFTQTAKHITNLVAKNKVMYLSKTDAVYITIKARVISDFKIAKQTADPQLPENKLKTEKLKSMSEEKQKKYYSIFEKSMRDYTDQLELDFETFMLVFNGLGDDEQKKMEAESDFRVRNLGGNKYAAEFWEDAIAANSETNAIVWAKKLSERYPDDKTILPTVKETYAKTRKLVKDGKQKRYLKIIGFLYTKDKDGLILFNNPGQALIDFK